MFQNEKKVMWDANSVPPKIFPAIGDLAPSLPPSPVPYPSAAERNQCVTSCNSVCNSEAYTFTRVANSRHKVAREKVERSEKKLSINI